MLSGVSFPKKVIFHCNCGRKGEEALSMELNMSQLWLKDKQQLKSAGWLGLLC